MIVAILLSGLIVGALIVAIAYVAARLVPEGDASTRYALWFASLLALVAVPVFALASTAGAQLLSLLRPSGVQGVTITLLPVGALARDATAVPASATGWLVAAWAVGVAFGFARLLASYVRIEGIRRRARSHEIGGERVLVSADIAIPIAAGFIAPAVILPEAIVATLAPADVRRIVAHERAHIRRGDVLGNLVQRSIEALLFFNPWVYAIGRNLVHERESACDDLAVARTGEAEDYAVCLVALARGIGHRRAPLLTPSAFGSRNALVTRIDRLLRNGSSRATSLNYYSIAGTVAAFALLTLTLQACEKSPTPASTAQPVRSTSNAHVASAAACTTPNADAMVTNPVAPNMPHAVLGPKSANILVAIDAHGNVSKTTIAKSSGDRQLDAAAVVAAGASTYSPARVNCNPVPGKYIFHVEFNPG